MRFHREIPESRDLVLDSAKIRKIVCDVFGIEEEVLQQSRRGRENEARDVAIFLQKKYCGQTLAELGKDYGIPNYSTVSSACERVKARLSKDRILLTTLKEIENNL